MKYIYHHLGLGDHIVCNAIVRITCSENINVTLFCYHHNFKSLKFMFGDINNLTILPFHSDGEILNYIQSNNLHNQTLKIGFEKMGKYYHTHSFDEAFYQIANIPFSLRFEKFHVERNLEIEQYVYTQLNPTNEDYIFVHDDTDRGFSINQSKYRQDLKVIQNDKRFNIFEMLKIYENAKGVHFMESSISALLNSLPLPNIKFFLHKYVRNYDNFGHTKSINKIEIIE